MFRRAQIVGFFLLLVALMTGTTWLAQAGDDDSPDVDSPDVTVVTTLEAAPETSEASAASVPPTTQPQPTQPTITSPDTTSPGVTTSDTATSEATTTSTLIESTTAPSTTSKPTTTETTVVETTVVETTTEPSTITTETQSTTVKVSGQAGLRLGNSVAPGPNLLRLNFFDQQTDERVQSIVYTGLTNTGDYSAELRTDITYRVDVIVCCNAPTVTLSFRDLSFDADTTLDLTVPAVEVVFEVVSEAGGPVANATIVIPAASGSNGQAIWSARVYAAPTDENGETQTVLPIGTSSNEDRLPTLELEDGVKTTFQFTVLEGPGTDVAGPTGPVTTTEPSATVPPTTVTTSTLPPTTIPASTSTSDLAATTTSSVSEPTSSAPNTTVAEPTTTGLATESTTGPTSEPEPIETPTSETTPLAALEEGLDIDTDTSGPTPTTIGTTTEQASPEPNPTTTIATPTSSAPGPAPATTVNEDQTTTTQTESPTTSLPTTVPPTTVPDTTSPNTNTSDTASPDNPDPIAPTPDGTNTVRITLVAPTSIELSGKAGLEILGELAPGSHSLRINFYRADTDELGAQVTYTGEDNDGSYETHLIAGAAYRIEVIVCCEGPTVRLVYDNVVFSESTVRDLLAPAAKFEIKVVDHEDSAVDDATIIFDELSGTTSNEAIAWYASGQPRFDSDSNSFPVVLPIASIVSTDQTVEDVGPTSLIVGDVEAVSFTIPSITFNINTLLIKLNEDGDSVVTEPALTRPWVTPTLSAEANEAGWINEEAEIHWTVTDPAPEVGLPQTTLAPTPVDKEGIHIYWSEEACDLDENCSKGSLEVSLDSTAPSVGIHGFVKGTLRTTEPTPTCTAEDSGSGLLIITIDDDSNDGDGDGDEAGSWVEADCNLETKVRSSEPIIADAAEDSDEEIETSEPALFLTIYEVTATATDLAGNVTTEVETYQMETDEQVEVTATPTETEPPATEPPTTTPPETTQSTSAPESTTTPETTTSETTAAPETTTTGSTTTPETTISETTTVPETATPDTNPPATAPPEATPEPEETSPTPGAVSISRLVQLR